MKIALDDGDSAHEPRIVEVLIPQAEILSLTKRLSKVYRELTGEYLTVAQGRQVPKVSPRQYEALAWAVKNEIVRAGDNLDDVQSLYFAAGTIKALVSRKFLILRAPCSGEFEPTTAGRAEVERVRFAADSIWAGSSGPEESKP